MEGSVSPPPSSPPASDSSPALHKSRSKAYKSDYRRHRPHTGGRRRSVKQRPAGGQMPAWTQAERRAGATALSGRSANPSIRTMPTSPAGIHSSSGAAARLSFAISMLSSSFFSLPNPQLTTTRAIQFCPSLMPPRASVFCRITIIPE